MTQSSNTGLMRHVSLRRRFLQSAAARALQPASGLLQGQNLLRLAAIGVVAGLAACGSEPRSGPATVEIRGTDPNGTATASAESARETSDQPSLSADGGIVDHGSYQTAIARGGDTVSDIAGRLGISSSQLADYNGLTPSHELREGDELVLPRRPEGYDGTAIADAGASAGTSAADSYTGPETSAIDVAPLPGADGRADGDSSPENGADETHNPGGWSPDLAAAAIERSTGLQEDGSLGAPPSSSEPMPPEPPARRELESPDLGRYQTGASSSDTGSADTSSTDSSSTEETAPAAPASGSTSSASASSSGASMIRPVDGRVASAFNKTSGPGRNDGVDFAAEAGAPVKAAAGGEVALVSKSLGGLGTIVLVRHDDDLLTVYGRIDNVSVQKGDQVSAGQSIGVVSAGSGSEEPLMHFEVRRGAESLDPMEFLPG